MQHEKIPNKDSTKPFRTRDYIVVSNLASYEDEEHR